MRIIGLIITAFITIIVIFSTLLNMFFSEGLAINHEPVEKTNINEQTNLFKDNIDSYEQLIKNLEKDKEKARYKIEAEEGVEDLADSSKGEVNREANKISNKSDNELKHQGEQELVKKEWRDIEVDYSKPGNSQLLRDAKQMGKDAEREVFNRLQQALYEVGVNCQEEEGEEIREPNYQRKTRKEHRKDEEYNQVYCEQPYNKYRCTERLIPFCKDKTFKRVPLNEVQGGCQADNEGNITINPGGRLPLKINGGIQQINCDIDIKDPQKVHSLILGGVVHDDHLLMKLNGNIIAKSGGVQDRLHTLPFDIMSSRGVALGPNNFKPSDLNTGVRSMNPQKEVKEYLKQGHNRIEVAVAYGKKSAALKVHMHYREHDCNEWEEHKYENCIME